jgi:NTP pyrophosphatase (non-canonical NTP hydrolase)
MTDVHVVFPNDDEIPEPAPKLSFDEYQAGVLKTWNSSNSEDARRINATLGLAGEAGEFADLMKKHLFHGLSDDGFRDKVLSELGDVLYYVTVCAYEHGFHLETIAKKNNEKLAARYPQGFKKGGGIRE